MSWAGFWYNSNLNEKIILNILIIHGGRLVYAYDDVYVQHWILILDGF